VASTVLLPSQLAPAPPAAFATDDATSPPAPRNLTAALVVAGDGAAPAGSAAGGGGGGASCARDEGVGGDIGGTQNTTSGSLSQLLTMLRGLAAAAQAGAVSDEDATSALTLLKYQMGEQWWAGIDGGAQLLAAWRDGAAASGAAAHPLSPAADGGNTAVDGSA
jgi:hypothetical protein